MTKIQRDIVRSLTINAIWYHSKVQLYLLVDFLISLSSILKLQDTVLDNFANIQRMIYIITNEHQTKIFSKGIHIFFLLRRDVDMTVHREPWNGSCLFLHIGVTPEKGQIILNETPRIVYKSYAIETLRFMSFLIWTYYCSVNNAG